MNSAIKRHAVVESWERTGGLMSADTVFIIFVVHETTLKVESNEPKYFSKYNQASNGV